MYILFDKASPVWESLRYLHVPRRMLVALDPWPTAPLPQLTELHVTAVKGQTDISFLRELLEAQGLPCLKWLCLDAEQDEVDEVQDYMTPVCKRRCIDLCVDIDFFFHAQ